MILSFRHRYPPYARPSKAQRFVPVFVVLALLLCVADTAYPQGLTRKESSVEGVQERNKRKTSRSRPTLAGRPRISRANLIATTIETRLIKGINRSLQQMRNIAGGLPKRSPQKLEVMKRMLQMQLEQAQYIKNQEYEAYDRRWEAWNAKGRGGPEPEVSHVNSNRMLKKSLKLSSQVIKEYPKYKKLDAVIYQQAVAKQYIGQTDSAARDLSIIIQRFPNSSLAGDAYYLLGEYYFESNQHEKAEIHYLKVVRSYKRSRQYLSSLFKLGWTYYNVAKYRKALTYWKQTVSSAKRSSNDSAKHLRDEALRDMVYTFAEIGDINQATSYFRANGGAEYVGKFLLLLANTWVDQGKFRQAIQVFKKLQSHAPASPAAPEAQNLVVELQYEIGHLDAVWKELRFYAVRYGKNSPWAKANSANSQLVLETQKSIQDQILYYAKITHKNSQQRKSKALAAHAEKGYKLYLSMFPKTQASVEVRFNLADLYYFQQSYTTAGKLYLEVAAVGKKNAVIYDDKGKPVKNIHQNAAQFMLDAFYKAFEPELKQILAIKQPPDLSKPKKPLSTRANNFIRACGSYLKWYPRNSKIKKNCNVYIAEIYYRHNDRKNALTYLWVVARTYPGTKEGEKAVLSIVPLYKNDKKSLNLALLELLKEPGYSKGKVGKKLRDVLQGVHEEDVDSEKDLIARAKGYLKLAKKYPNSKIVHKYYHNAAVTFIKAGDLTSAVEADKVIVTRFKNIPEAKDSLLRIAQMSANLVNYNNALKYYKLYAARYPNAKDSLQALKQSCDLAIVITNNPSEILSHCQPLRSKNPPAFVSRVEDVILTLFARREFSRMSQVISLYLKIPGVSPAQRVNAMHKLFIAGGRKVGGGDAQRILATYRSATANIQGDPLARRAVAEILFLRAEAMSQGYSKIKLRGGSLQNMEASIAKKQSALQAVESALTQVIQIQDAHWGVSAQYQLGRIWEELGMTFSNPPGIKGAKIADVKKQLAPLAKQSFDKAQNFFQKAHQDANEFDIFSPHSLAIQAALHRRKGSAISTADWVLPPDFIGSPVSSDILAVSR